MKGIVVEINDKDAVVLSDDGLFAKVRNQNYTIGQTIDTRESMSFGIKRSSAFGTRWVAATAGMAAAMAISTIGAFAYYTPDEYVSMDVNPSVEYTLNMFDRILDVKAVNEDGKAILKNLDLKNMDIEDALKETLDQLIQEGYLTDDPDGGVVITTSDDKPAKADKLADDLEEEIQSYLDSREGINAKVDAEAVKPERVEEAKKLGVTPGKLNLVEKLQNSTTGAISEEELLEWLDKPVKEINKAIKENRKSEKSDSEDQTDQDIKNENGKTRSDRETMNQGSQPEDYEASQDDSESTADDVLKENNKGSNGNGQNSQFTSSGSVELTDDTTQSDKNNNKNKEKSDSKENPSDDTDD